MRKPLEGIKVLDLSTFVAAPVCGRMLGDLGADVIKIERPSGDAWRETGKGFNRKRFSDDANPVFDIYNSGKKFLAVDMKTPEGMEIFWKLMGEADVFLTNNREGALKRLGISYEDVKDRYPRLVYAAVTGYGDKGPDASTPAFDVTAFWTRSGFLRDMSPGGEHYQPMMPPSSAGDTITATNLCTQICAALYNREKTGKGDFVRASLYQAGIFTFASMILSTQEPAHLQYPRERYLGTASGGVSGTYQCGDDEWIFLATAGNIAYNPKIFRMVGCPDMAEDPKYVDRKYCGNVENATALFNFLKSKFITKPCAEWLALGKEFDVPLVRMNHFKDVAEEEQAWANGFLEKMEYENGVSLAMPTSPFIMDSVGEIKTKPAPRIGGNTREVLLDMGYSNEEIDKLTQAGVLRTCD